MVPFPVCQSNFKTKRKMVCHYQVLMSIHFVLCILLVCVYCCYLHNSYTNLFPGIVQSVVKRGKGKNQTKVTRMINQKNNIFCVYYIYCVYRYTANMLAKTKHKITNNRQQSIAFLHIYCTLLINALLPLYVQDILN